MSGPTGRQPTPTPKQLGADLREARKLAGMTQAALADAMKAAGFGLDGSTISRIESGERELGYREALVLRELVGFGVAHADMRAFREAAAFRRIKEAMDEAVSS